MAAILPSPRPRPAVPHDPLVAHDGAHDLFLRRLGAGELADEGAVVHDADAVADAEQLGHLRGDHHDALAGLRQLVDDTVDLVFGADVDAAGRLVEDQDLGVGHQPFRQHDLLLVAAGEVGRSPDRRRSSGCASGCGSRWRPSVRAMSSITPPRRDLLEARQRDVLADVVGQDQPELLAVLGDIGEAGVDRRGDAGQIDLAGRRAAPGR